MSDQIPFEKHLFISYAHIDNETATPEEKGWVTRFHAALEVMLTMRLGRKAEIWRDLKLKGNDLFSDEIVSQLPKTALLLSVLSPRYAESDWCTKEVEKFCEAVRQSAVPLVVDNQCRIFKVIKTPKYNEQALPKVMRELLGYEFFIWDDDQSPIELDSAYGAELGQKFNLKVAKLGYQIAEMLRRLSTVAPAAASSQTAAAGAPEKPAIYLAETSSEMRYARETIESELRMHGYRIVPDRQLPTTEEDYVAKVKTLLDDCALSVHLVGGQRGLVPDGPSETSVVVLQNELAIQKSRSSGLPRIIWLPEAVQSKHADQQKFIESLRQDAEAQFGADLVTGDVEALKAIVHAALEKIEKPKAAAASEAGDPLVYLICDERDRKDAVPVRKYLRAQGLEVKIPVFEGDAKTLRDANQDLLKNCDGILVYYGAGSEAWKRTVDTDLKKMNAYRDSKPPVRPFTYLAQPETADKSESIELEEPNVIDGLRGFVESQLQAFVRQFRKAATP